MHDLMQPALPLIPFLEGYWHRRGIFKIEKKVRVLADACTKLIFEFAPTPWPSCYLVGTQLTPIIVSLCGRVDRVGIRFRPGMARFLLARPLAGLANPYVPFLPIDLPEIHGRLAVAPSIEGRTHILDQWLAAQLPAVASFEGIIEETRLLNRGFFQGLTPSELAASMGWTGRRLQRICRDRYGATAAGLYRVHRFQALQVRFSGLPAPLADLAAELGFSDQAHMAREFRHFAGTTITLFLRERAGVGNLQDGEDWLPVLREVEGDEL